MSSQSRSSSNQKPAYEDRINSRREMNSMNNSTIISITNGDYEKKVINTESLNASLLRNDSMISELHRPVIKKGVEQKINFFKLTSGEKETEVTINYGRFNIPRPESKNKTVDNYSINYKRNANNVLNQKIHIDRDSLIKELKDETEKISTRVEIDNIKSINIQNSVNATNNANLNENFPHSSRGYLENIKSIDNNFNISKYEEEIEEKNNEIIKLKKIIIRLREVHEEVILERDSLKIDIGAKASQNSEFLKLSEENQKNIKRIDELESALIVEKMNNMIDSSSKDANLRKNQDLNNDNEKMKELELTINNLKEELKIKEKESSDKDEIIIDMHYQIKKEKADFNTKLEKMNSINFTQSSNTFNFGIENINNENIELIKNIQNDIKEKDELIAKLKSENLEKSNLIKLIESAHTEKVKLLKESDIEKKTLLLQIEKLKSQSNSDLVRKSLIAEMTNLNSISNKYNSSYCCDSRGKLHNYIDMLADEKRTNMGLIDEIKSLREEIGKLSKVTKETQEEAKLEKRNNEIKNLFDSMRESTKKFNEELDSCLNLEIDNSSNNNRNEFEVSNNNVKFTKISNVPISELKSSYDNLENFQTEISVAKKNFNHDVEKATEKNYFSNNNDIERKNNEIINSNNNTHRNVVHLRTDKILGNLKDPQNTSLKTNASQYKNIIIDENNKFAKESNNNENFNYESNHQNFFSNSSRISTINQYNSENYNTNTQQLNFMTETNDILETQPPDKYDGFTENFLLNKKQDFQIETRLTLDLNTKAEWEKNNNLNENIKDKIKSESEEIILNVLRKSNVFIIEDDKNQDQTENSNYKKNSSIIKLRTKSGHCLEDFISGNNSNEKNILPPVSNGIESIISSNFHSANSSNKKLTDAMNIIMDAEKNLYDSVIIQNLTINDNSQNNIDTKTSEINNLTIKQNIVQNDKLVKMEDKSGWNHI